ncbi:hypothetical protein BC2230_30265 [Burkholderia cepacia]
MFLREQTFAPQGREPHEIVTSQPQHCRN